MISNVQYLRGIAAMMVVLFHVTDGAGRLGPGVALPRFGIGEAGVDIFFAISGFIIWTTTRRGGARPGDFLRRRFFRVAPLYWAITGLLAAVALVKPDLLATTVIEAGHLAASFLFLPYPHPTLGAFNPLLFVGWTLNYEMAFYALFALVLFLPPKAHLGAATGAIALLAGFGHSLAPVGAAGFYTDPIILEFAMGILIGAAYTRGWSPPALLSLGLMVLGAGLIVLAGTHPSPRALLAGVPAAMVVAGGVFLHRAGLSPRLPLLGLIGDASYSIYLTHVLTLPVAQILWRKLGPAAAGGMAIAYVAAATLACTIVGVLCYRLLEVPLGRFCHRFTTARTAGTRIAAAGSGA